MQYFYATLFYALISLVCGYLCTRWSFYKKTNPIVAAILGVSLGPLSLLVVPFNRNSNYNLLTKNSPTGLWNRLFLIDIYLVVIVEFIGLCISFYATYVSGFMFEESYFYITSITLIGLGYAFYTRKKDSYLRNYIFILLIYTINYVAFFNGIDAEIEAPLTIAFQQIFFLLLSLRTVTWLIYSYIYYRRGKGIVIAALIHEGSSLENETTVSV
jgi:hypothetical protein